MGKKIQSNKILLDFGGDVGKKTVEQLIISHNNLLKQRDELLEAVKEAKRVICSMKLSMWVHPDCSKDSEFYDMATTGEETEDKLEDLITKIEQK